ncbi:uncharacterized protein EI90DRAFT_3016941 [Cantharellus anzutake]|uniref:uncharacterized protein n=1 Tax=Cantharellus anzutake TaxID=1750568 RepID=UPI001903733F|nr:uncharacterized protein EI90DRAFT_3016941 [Cantharellus anzutake]KAF8329986.1 hypothetical protein EI90DRAFT_3016941 [Cantharellus anzutake]
MESTIISHLLAHTQAEDFLGLIDASSLSYKSATSSNGQSICGSWVLQEKCNVLGEFALFGIISMTELFADQIRALNQIKNASGLGVHCKEDVIEICENEFRWAYLDNQNCPFLWILHPMFLESRASPLKEGKKVKVSLALETDAASPASVTTSNNDATPSVFSHPQWDPKGHYHHALPSPNMQRDFKFHVNLHAFDDNSIDVSCNGIELIFKEGMAVIGTVSLHLYILLFDYHATAVLLADWPIVGRAGALQEDPIVIVSSSKKCIAEEELPGLPKHGPFFTCNGKEVASKALSGNTQGKLDSKQDTLLDVKELVVIEDEVMCPFISLTTSKADEEDWVDL